MRSSTLRYEVPDHQGQEVLGAALLEHGYHWTSEFVGGRTHLLISASDGEALDRERVRVILAGEHRTSLSGPEMIYTEVRFEDEPRSAQGAAPAEEAATPARSRLRGPLLHAVAGGILTGLGYALLRADHRRAALLSAGVALTFAAAELRRARA